MLKGKQENNAELSNADRWPSQIAHVLSSQVFKGQSLQLYFDSRPQVLPSSLYENWDTTYWQIFPDQ